MLRYLDEDFGNAGSRTHEFGRRARTAVEQARDRVAAVVASSRGDVIFTSGATESNNLAILGLAAAAGDRRHIVSTAIEHHAVLEPLEELRRRGFDVTLVPPDQGGVVDAGAVLAALRPDTLLVSMMHVNNETGVIQPIAEVADRPRRPRIPIFTSTPRRVLPGVGHGTGRAASSARRSDQRERAQDQRAQGRGGARGPAARRTASAAAAADVRRRAGAAAAPGDACPCR